MKAKEETIGMINLTNGIGEGQTITVGRKKYFFKHVAVSRVDAFCIVEYFIVKDEKNKLHVLDSNTKCTVL